MITAAKKKNVIAIYITEPSGYNHPLYPKDLSEGLQQRHLSNGRMGVWKEQIFNVNWSPHLPDTLIFKVLQVFSKIFHTDTQDWRRAITTL